LEPRPINCTQAEGRENTPLLYGLALSVLADRLAPGEFRPLSRPVALGGSATIAVFIAAGLAKFGATVAEIV
jgi:hypothetical protein